MGGVGFCEGRLLDEADSPVEEVGDEPTALLIVLGGADLLVVDLEVLFIF